MKFPRLLFCLALLGSLSGCATRYATFRATNYRGELISEWTAKGPYQRVPGGYRIMAVQRISGPPYKLRSRYPDGRPATVTGPNIVHWNISKPLWIYELERPFEPTANHSRQEIRPLPPMFIESRRWVGKSQAGNSGAFAGVNQF